MLTVERTSLLAVATMALALIVAASAGYAQETTSEPAAVAPAGEAGKPAAPAPTEPAAPTTVPGQATTAPAAGPAETVADLWDNLLHYIKIARPDLASSYGDAILKSGAAPLEVYQLSAKTPGSLTTLARGANLEGMKEVVEKLQKVIEQGYQADRSNPQEIADAIKMLEGGPEAYELAKSRLQKSGEYALPQLVAKLIDPKTSDKVRGNIVSLLPSMGKEVVQPLAEALGAKDEPLLEIVASVLGRMQNPVAAPALKGLIERKDIQESTRQVARAALLSCSREGMAQKSTAGLYYDLAQAYYDQNESLRPDPRNEMANVWYWKEGLGLTYVPVPRGIYDDVYAMRTAKEVLRHDPQFYPAVSLWIAADLKKEADLPSGAKDPTRGADQPSARFYALASSAGLLQEVLARALTDKNSAVAIGAIEALRSTAGAKSLVIVSGGAQPLVQALSYPDREVRFLAALALAQAMPDETFTGADQVMPVLSEALRQAGKKVALLIASQTKQDNALKDALRAAGYELIENPDPVKALEAARASSGVDAVVLGSKPDLADVLALMRKDPAFVAVPVVTAAERMTDLAKADGKVVIVSPGALGTGLAAALEQAAKLATGRPVTSEQALAWALDAAKAIRQLGLRRNPVLNILRARPALLAALGDPRDEVKVAAAEALAVMNDAEAQRAIAKLGINDQGPEKVRIEAFGALSESLRTYGNLMTDELSRAVLGVVTATGSQPLREAAAQALGAMNLPSDKITSLFFQTTGD